MLLLMLIFVTKMTLLEKKKICRTFRAVGHLGTLPMPSKYEPESQKMIFRAFASNNFRNIMLLSEFAFLVLIMVSHQELTRPRGGILLLGIIVGQGPTALAVGADGVVWTFFSRLSFKPLSFVLPSGRRPDTD